jgi:hypothetical protein
MHETSKERKVDGEKEAIERSSISSQMARKGETETKGQQIEDRTLKEGKGENKYKELLNGFGKQIDFELYVSEVASAMN